jgi:hypothetical protein
VIKKNENSLVSTYCNDGHLMTGYLYTVRFVILGQSKRWILGKFLNLDNHNYLLCIVQGVGLVFCQLHEDAK